MIGKGSEEEMTAALNLGAAAFLATPVRPQLLSMVFSQMMKRIELESEVQEAQRRAARIQKELEQSLERQKEAIAEKDLTYRELLLAYSRLQELNQQKNNFLAMATHELRTPVTVMKGYHRILLDERLGKLQPQQKEVLLESEQSCSRLIRIINSLLDLSRIEAGKLELIYQENDFINNVKMVIKQTKEACKRKQLSLVLKLSKGIRRFRYDRDKVNQVLTHLLENSIKYTPPGGKVYVSVEPYFWERRSADAAAGLKPQKEQRHQLEERTNHSSNAIMVQVTDTGIGISPEHQQEIFDEFTQVSSNQMNRSGLGLGLNISKRIIEAHGGKIWVDSHLNSGSKFIFLLPLSPIETSPGINEIRS
jgi:signal transduction histidine kinase